ncbi:tenascin-X isoform X2 [Latimeria chalumnae]|uniref:tenascin-X isoform X2 n=1 Tax=Latimeria chalumnae TaxID=7897 RepID=UPI00313EFAF9
MRTLFGPLLFLAATVLELTGGEVVTRTFRHRREKGGPLTVFDHVYSIRMPHCQGCLAEVSAPTLEVFEARDEPLPSSSPRQLRYEHTVEGGEEVVFTHRINIPPKACDCIGGLDVQQLLDRLEALEEQVSSLQDQCRTRGCCSRNALSGLGLIDVRVQCSGHGKFDPSKCVCVCDKGWTGPMCSNASCPSACSHRGQCVDGRCVCAAGFTGVDCSRPHCPEDCSDQGRCVEGKCVCFEGYTGPACEHPACPQNCQGRGQCVNGKCVCNPGFSGANCGLKTCPDLCNNRGRCVDGRCICDSGFAGPSCSIRTCPKNCNDHGQCVTGKCICNPGFGGLDCGTKLCPDNCWNQGRCVDGKCICDSGFSGPSCREKECPDNCKNRGRCVDGSCVCDPGFSGPNCGERECPDKCKNRGRCVNGKCVCDPGFSGPNCGEKECPDKCKNHGRCVDGRCICNPGFSGPNCGEKACPENCKNHGRCVDGKCVCDPGFSGPNCGEKECPDKCKNHGRCVDGRCICNPGFSGPNCGEKACPENCKNHGRCVDGKCVCDPGFSGPNCGEKECPDKCRNRGRCVDGKCVCNPGFSGPNCGEKACPENCKGHGRCVEGKCICDPGFHGPICGQRTCPSNCHNRGRCVNGSCVCRRGYTGADCGSQACVNNCHNRGSCVNGRCVCNEGFTGPTCATKTCRNNCNRKGRCVEGKCVCEEGFTGDDCSIEIPAVEGLRPKIITETSVTVEWNRPKNQVDGYNISIIPVKEEDGAITAHLRGTASSYEQTGLAPGQQYRVTIRAERNRTLGTATTKTFTTVIDSPKNLRAIEVTESTITLRWEKSTSAIDRYVITYISSAGRQMQLELSGDVDTVTLTQLESGLEYTITLAAEKGQERSKSISIKAATALRGPTATPAAVEGLPPDINGSSGPGQTTQRPIGPGPPGPKLGELSVQDVTPRSVRVAWAVGHGNFSYFFLLHQDPAANVSREVRLPGRLRTFRIVGLEPATKYEIELRGEAEGRRSPAVATKVTTASLPKDAGKRLGGLSVTDITANSLRLSWAVPEGDFDSFVIQHRDSEDQMKKQRVTGDSRTALISGLSPSTKYTFYLFGVMGNKRSKPVSIKASTESVGVQPGKLGKAQVSDVTVDSLRLSWVVQEGAFDSFLLWYRDAAGASPASEATVGGGLRSTRLDGLRAGTQYNLTLYGVYQGHRSAPLHTTATTNALGLEPARDLTFTNVTDTSFTVNWILPLARVDRFKITYELSEGGEPQSISVDEGKTRLRITSLSPGLEYKVSVISVRGFKESEPLAGAITTAPDTPTDLRVVNVTESTALLLWRPALAAVDNYVITYGTRDVPEVRRMTPGNVAELLLSGLNVDTKYIVKLHSEKGSQQSVPTSTSFTTAADSPRDLTAGQVTPRSAILSWKPPRALPTSYVLTYETPVGETKEVTLDPSVTQHKLMGLTPSVRYNARLHAIRGNVRMSPLVTAFTTVRVRYPFPQDCSEELMNGRTESGVMMIFPGGDREQPVQIFCDMETDGGGWIVFQRRMNGKTNFWRKWWDYAVGFGNLTEEFWLGNDHLHQLTSQRRYALRVDLRAANESVYAVYDNFRVGDLKSHYRLALGEYSGTAGDSLHYHDGSIFSTKDRDPSKHIAPCALSYKGAWWYKNCHFANLNGLYGSTKDHQGINWYDWKGFEFSIPFTEMKMRPFDFEPFRRA